MADRKHDDERRGPGSRHAVAGASPFNALHVECIRAALARKEYVIDARRIADKILQFERGFPG